MGQRFLLIFTLFVSLFYFPAPVCAAGESWLSGWSYRRAITIDHDKVGGGTENESNFPVLVSVSGLSNIKDNGADIRFTDSDGNTELPREIESYAAGTLVAWVKVPTVSYTANTVVYMYYGNSSSTEPDANTAYGSKNVWTENYAGVWHMGSSLTADSTSNGNNGTNTGVTSTTSGKVGAGGTFDGASFISVPDTTGTGNDSLNPTKFTVEFWVNTTSYKFNSWNVFVAKETWTGSKGWFFYRGNEQIGDQNTFNFIRGGHDTPKDTVTNVTNGWQHVAGTYNGLLTMELFMDGSSKSKNTNIPAPAYSSSTVPLFFGSRHGNDGTGNGDYGVGTLDEIRISSVVRTSGWISTGYNNQNSPSTFSTTGSEETAPVVTPTPAPISASTSSSNNISAASPKSCGDSKPMGVPDLFQINSTKDSATLYFTPISGISTYYISYAANSSAESHGVEVHLGSNGVQQYTIHALSPGTIYYFKVRGQNGCMPGNWSSIKETKTSSDFFLTSPSTEGPLDFMEEPVEDEKRTSPTSTPTPTIFISTTPSESPSVKGTTTTAPPPKEFPLFISMKEHMQTLKLKFHT